MKRYSFIVLLFALMFLGAGVKGFAQEQQEAVLEIPLPQWLQVKKSQLSKDSILVGEQVVWSTQMELPQDQELMFAPYASVVEAEKAPVDVIHDIVLDTLAIRNGTKELEVKLLLTSFDSGYYKLPFMVALTPQGDTIYLDSPFLDVTNTPVDTANFVMHPIKGQMRYPVTFREVLPWAVLAIALAVLGYLLYRYIRHRREQGSLFGKPVVQDPPHIVALRELDRIRGEQLWQNGEEKLFYTGVTDALREYIEARYEVSAKEKTTSEIMADLSDKKIEPRYYKELDELFKTADLVKFAKYVPGNEENEEVIPMAVRFVNAAFEQQLQEAAQKEAAQKEAAQNEASRNEAAQAGQNEKVEE